MPCANLSGILSLSSALSQTTEVSLGSSGLHKRHHNHGQLPPGDTGLSKCYPWGQISRAGAELPLNTIPAAARCTLPFPSL